MNNELKDIELHLIDEPPEAMRSDIDRDELFELAKDIKQNGLINPITVRPIADRYEVVAGHRRLLAHRYGGIPHIRCVIRNLTDDEAFGIMTSENLARVDVNVMDESMHTLRLMKMHNGDIEKVRHIMNRSKEWVMQRCALAEMPPHLQDVLREGRIKIGAALALMKITNEVDRDACIKMAMQQGASITMINYWVAQWDAGLFGIAVAQDLPDSNIPEDQRRVILLECAVDGKKYRCEEMQSIMIWGQNRGYIDSLKAHLQLEESEKSGAPSPEA
jgi:ParB/RepB/Spo0J family partition protein